LRGRGIKGGRGQVHLDTFAHAGEDNEGLANGNAHEFVVGAEQMSEGVGEARVDEELGLLVVEAKDVGDRLQPPSLYAWGRGSEELHQPPAHVRLGNARQHERKCRQDVGEHVLIPRKQKVAQVRQHRCDLLRANSTHTRAFAPAHRHTRERDGETLSIERGRGGESGRMA
jgi:hypothetical protein